MTSEGRRERQHRTSDPYPTESERAASKKGAPDPDHPSKPDTPTDLTKPSWKYVLRKTLREFNRDQVTDLAAALTYWGVLAIAPSVLALISLLGVFGDGDQIVSRVTAEADKLGMDVSAITPIIQQAASKQGAGLALITGLLVALWSASGYVNAFSRAMNRIYEIDEGRPIWKLRPVMLVVTLVMLLLVAVICAALVVSGPIAETIGGFIGLSDVAVTVWNIAKWPVIVILVALVIAILYYATPNVRQPKFTWISVGSFVAIVVWALATAGLAVYLGTFGGSASYNETYGTLAGVIIFLLWMWITNNALLFGAELDAELERSRQLQAGIKAEETIQLPPRDTKASEKKAAKHEEDVERGRALRLSNGEVDDPEAAPGTAGDPPRDRDRDR